MADSVTQREEEGMRGGEGARMQLAVVQEAAMKRQLDSPKTKGKEKKGSNTAEENRISGTSVCS